MAYVLEGLGDSFHLTGNLAESIVGVLVHDILASIRHGDGVGGGIEVVAIDLVGRGNGRQEALPVNIVTGDAVIAVRFGYDIARRIVEVARYNAAPGRPQPVAHAVINKLISAADAEQPVFVIVEGVRCPIAVAKLAVVVVKKAAFGGGGKEAIPFVIIVVTGEARVHGRGQCFGSHRLGAVAVTVQGKAITGQDGVAVIAQGRQAVGIVIVIGSRRPVELGQARQPPRRIVGIGGRLVQPVDLHRLHAIQLVIGIGDRLVARIGDGGDVARRIVLVGKGIPLRIRRDGEPVGGVISVARRADRILHGRQVVKLVVSKGRQGNPDLIFILAVIVQFIRTLLGQFVARGIVIINQAIVGQSAGIVIASVGYSAQGVSLAGKQAPFVISKRRAGANLIRQARHPADAVIGIGNGRMAAGGRAQRTAVTVIGEGGNGIAAVGGGIFQAVGKIRGAGLIQQGVPDFRKMMLDVVGKMGVVAQPVRHIGEAEQGIINIVHRLIKGIGCGCHIVVAVIAVVGAVRPGIGEFRQMVLTVILPRHTFAKLIRYPILPPLFVVPVCDGIATRIYLLVAVAGEVKVVGRRSRVAYPIIWT